MSHERTVRTAAIFAMMMTLLVMGKRQRFGLLAARVARCLLHVPGQQSFNLFQSVGRRDVLQYMM